MIKLSNTEAELKNSVSYKTKGVISRNFPKQTFLRMTLNRILLIAVLMGGLLFLEN